MYHLHVGSPLSCVHHRLRFRHPNAPVTHRFLMSRESSPSVQDSRSYSPRVPRTSTLLFPSHSRPSVERSPHIRVGSYHRRHATHILHYPRCVHHWDRCVEVPEVFDLLASQNPSPVSFSVSHERMPHQASVQRVLRETVDLNNSHSSLEVPQ